MGELLGHCASGHPFVYCHWFMIVWASLGGGWGCSEFGVWVDGAGGGVGGYNRLSCKTLLTPRSSYHPEHQLSI